MNLWLHVAICVATVIAHWLYLKLYCQYDMDIPYDKEQLPRLEKKMQHATYTVYFVLAASTLLYFTTQP